MTTKTQWREEFLVSVTKHGMLLDTARAILSRTKTLDRLAVAQCNGDWPADNGQRKVVECPRCACLWDPATISKKGCHDCRTTDRVRALIPEGWGVEFAGDPRGCVVKLKTPDGREIGVPS